MGEFHGGLNVNPVAMLSIGESYQAGVRYVPASIQEKEIAIADRKFETLRVGSENLQQRRVDFFSPSQPCEFPIIAKKRICHETSLDCLRLSDNNIHSNTFAGTNQRDNQIKVVFFSYNLWIMKKNAPLAFRIPGELKRGLQRIADHEARSMSQICELLLTIGVDAYEKEGTRYLQRVLSSPKEG